MPKKMADILKKNTYGGMSSHIQIIVTTFSFLSIGLTMSLWLLWVKLKKVKSGKEVLQKELEKSHKERNNLVRAYNGLSQMGKFAEEMGIDIKNYKTPEEEKNKWEFEERHTLLESGNVRHSYNLISKKGDNNE